jgi:MFS family permease
VARTPAAFTAFTALTSRTGLRRVLVAYALYDFVQFFVWLAIIFWSFHVGGAYLAGVAALVQMVPAAVLAPALASVGDRIPRGMALVVAYTFVGATCAITAMVLYTSAPIAVVLTAATAVTTGLAIVRPIHFAALPQLAATPDELVSANSLSSVADGIFRFLGPVAAGIVSATLGYWQVFVIAAALCLLAAGCCIGLRSGSAVLDTAHEPGGLRAALGGIATLWGDWGSLALLMVLTVDFVVTGALDVLGVAFAGDVLGVGATGAALVIGSLGIGGLVGAVMGASLSRGRRLAPVIVTGAVIEGLGFAAVALFRSPPPAMLVLAMAGTGGAIMLVSGRTLLQRATDDRVLARVFAVQESTTMIGTAAGAMLAPLLITRFSVAGAFVPLGIGCALLALLGVVLIKRVDAAAVYRPQEISLLRGVSFLSHLPEYDLERLAKNARWEVVVPGTVVVHQGDPGRLFYVIADGEFSVSVDGELRPVVLGPGVGFGEIALLRVVPRTATITSMTSARLLALDASDFLAAVTGSADGHAIAASVAATHLARDLNAAPDLNARC